MTAIIVIASITLALVVLMIMDMMVMRSEIIEQVAEKVIIMLKSECKGQGGAGEQSETKEQNEIKK